MKDPVVIDPPGFDPKAAWKECGEYVEKCGGITHDDGEVNWRAAFGADPGCCSCPICGEMYWAWGRVQRCCDFDYETDWWAMYSYGVQANRFMGSGSTHEQRMKSPYYAYGWMHPVDDPWEIHNLLPWPAIVKEFHETGTFADAHTIRLTLWRLWNFVTFTIGSRRYRMGRSFDEWRKMLKCLIVGHLWESHASGEVDICMNCYAWKDKPRAETEGRVQS